MLSMTGNNEMGKNAKTNGAGRNGFALNLAHRPFTRAATRQVEDLVEAELKRLTFRYLNAEADGPSLQVLPHRPTALVRECHQRLAGQPGIEVLDQAAFFAMASRLLRRVLVETARAQGAHDLLAIHEALVQLDQVDPRKAHVAELKYYGGLSSREVARILDISEMAAQRDWMTARRWIRRQI